ncbi:MAG: helix-turn-helix domain-containing protein [Ilumatobacteraceae bacterium]
MDKRLVDLGDFIRQRREAAQQSIRDLSRLAGVSNPYLSQIERGLRKPSAEILQQIARALHVSAETLYVRAGILDGDSPRSGSSAPSVEEAVLADPLLSADQKNSLLSVYRTYVNPAAN